MSDNLTCETCAHWQPADRTTSYQAPCGKGYGVTAFNQTCAEHSSRAFVSDAIAQQSQARGLTLAEWQRRLAGK